jgi:hypothetical protein
LKRFEDRVVYVSYTVSQWDMFESVLRIMGDKESEWKIVYEDRRKKYERGVELLKEGSRTGTALVLFTRVFWPNGGGDFSEKVVNEQLGLVHEDLDEATRFGLQLNEEGTRVPSVLSACE